MLFTTIFHWLWPMSAVVVLVKMVNYYLRHKRYFELGRKLPGPRPLPLVGNALYFVGDASTAVKKIGQLVGNRDLAAIWFGPKLMAVVNSPENAEIFFNDPNLLNHSEHYKLIKRGLGNGVFTTNGEQWKKARKLIVPTFNIKTLRHFLKTFHHQSEILVHEMWSRVGQKSFDVFSYVEKCTTKTIIETMFQKQFPPQEYEVVVETVKVFDKLVELIQERLYKVWLHNDFVYTYFSSGKKFDGMVTDLKLLIGEKIYGSREDVIQRTDESVLGENVFIRRLVDQYDDNDLIDHIMTLLGAGYDTSARVLSCLFVMLAIHPEIQEKAYQEVCDVHQEAENRHLEVEDVNKLKYLEMVIKETLRMFPPGPVIAREAAEDIVMGKHTIPKGAAVAINIYNIHRNPISYENPDEFDPDRFLPENDSKRHPYSFIPFAGGPRMCIGHKFAMWFMKIIISSVLRKYKLECDYKMEDIQVGVNMFLFLKNGYNIRIKSRI